MALVITKSASIVSLDATPQVAVTTGEGSPGFLKSVNDFVTAPLLGTIGDIYRFVRIPTNAKIKHVGEIITAVSTAGAVDFGVAFSDNPNDGTPPSLATLVNPVVQITGPVDNKLFGAAKATTAALLIDTDLTFAATSTIFTPAMTNLPLWQALVNLGATQFTTDPGGFFDIVAKVTTVPTVTSPTIMIKVDYVE